MSRSTPIGQATFYDTLEYQARGRASGVHGLLHQFRIDAFTIFAVPAHGPHGFHAIGKIVESTLRTMNNLLERLHASFFFYLLVGATTFLKAMLFSGLGEWVNARWVVRVEPQYQTKDAKSEIEGSTEAKPSVQWIARRRPILPVLLIIIVTHLLGIALFYLRTRAWFISSQEVLGPIAFLVLTSLPLVALLAKSSHHETTAPHYMLLKAFTLCLASMVVSVTSVLNFSLAATMAIALGLR